MNMTVKVCFAGWLRAGVLIRLIAVALIVLVSSEIRADTFADFFDTMSYSNQDGSRNWSGNWVESGDDGSPLTGDILITAGELMLQNRTNSITREVDLTGYDEATLSFDYRGVNFGKGDDIVIEIRSGGGGWTRLQQFMAGKNGLSGSASYPVPAANLAANTELRLRTGGKTGATAQFFVDNFNIDAFVIVFAGTYTDLFDVSSYSNQDGSLNWFGDWFETGDDGSPLTGDIQITGGELMVRNGNREITREVDLGGYLSADLSFDYRSVNFGKGDDISIEIRSGGGGWTRLQQFKGGKKGAAGTASYAIPASNLAANTELRFRTGGKTGATSQFFVNNFNINAFAAGASTPDHFDISLSAGAFGINCVSHQIKVTAHDSSHNPFTTYVGEIQLATTTGVGDWSDAGLGNNGAVVNGPGGDGIATYQYLIGDAGEADFYLDYTTGALNTVGIDVNDTAVVALVDDSVQTIQFSPNGFTLTQNPLSNPPPDPINDPVVTQVAGTNFNVSLAAYGQTPTDSDCGIIEAYTGSHELHFWVTYGDPAAGTITPTVDGQSALSQECAVPGPPDCGLVANRQTVTFVNGQASVTVKYKDAGGISLNTKDDDFEAAEALTIRGTTGVFVVQPSEFAITTVETGASVANPGTTAAGVGFTAAGESFHVVVEARDAEGSLVANYGNEVAPEGVRLILDSLVYPAGGGLGTLGNAASFTPTATSGEFENSTVSWNQVGTMKMRAGIGDGSYLGTGDVVGPATGNVGRFYPDHFELISSTVTDSCASGTFSYMSQPAIDVNYTLEARSKSAVATTNYDNFDLAYAATLPTYHAEDSNDGTDLAARLSIASGQWDDGVLAFTSSSSSFDRAIAPDGPYSALQLGLQISDPDAADFLSLDFKPADNNNCVLDGDCVGVAIGATLDARFGRMQLKDGFGPELAAIPMSWLNEYWDGTSFIANRDDHCSQLAISDVSFGAATTVVNAAADTIAVTLSGITSVFSFADPIGASDCLTLLDIGFCDGQAGIEYAPPGAIVTYSISVNLTSLPFLRFDWNQDGDYSDTLHPPVNINFQSYRGHDRVIYWQEVLR
jgi:hypothetical protein